MDSSAQRGNHREYEDMAVAHVLGGLDQQRGRVFRAHLLDCADCRARVGELRAIAHDLAGVEQAERRVRGAQTVEMKSREQGPDAAGEQPADPPRSRPWLSRIVVLGGVTLFVVLAAYTFTLREQVTTLNQALDERLAASAALEHGQPLRVAYAAPGMTATTKVHDGRLVVLLEGVDEQRAYGLYLVRGQGESSRTLRREAMRPTDGRLFFLVGLQGTEERLIVTEPDPEAAFPSDPGGVTVLEAALPGP